MLFTLKMQAMQLTSLDLNLLPILHALLQESSVKRAAQRVGLSVSATSHALSRIRGQFGDPILVRAGREMQLTTRAKEMQTELAGLMRDMSGFFTHEQEFRPETLEDRLTIQTPDNISFMLVDRADHTLRAGAPGLDIHTIAYSAQVIENLRSGQVDLGIGVYKHREPDIHYDFLCRDTFVLVLRQGHPALESPISLETYAALNHVLVAPRGKPGGVVDEVLAKVGLKRRVARTTYSGFAAAHLVARTDYILTLSRRMVEALRGTLEFEVREPPIKLPSYDIECARHKSRRRDPLLNWFVQNIQNEIPMNDVHVPYAGTESSRAGCTDLR